MAKPAEPPGQANKPPKPPPTTEPPPVITEPPPIEPPIEPVPVAGVLLLEDDARFLLETADALMLE